MEKTNEIKERLKTLRKHFGIKQKDLAEKLGVSLGAVGTWEMGKDPIPQARIYQICYNYNVRPDWLESGEGPMQAPEKQEETPKASLEDFSDNEIKLEAIKRIYNSLPDDLRAKFVLFCLKLR